MTAPLERRFHGTVYAHAYTGSEPRCSTQVRVLGTRSRYQVSRIYRFGVSALVLL